ncbi:hypothetical protein L9Z73_03050 [Pseudomonas sp. TNT11]|uniref:Uncharacterized protein n=1 Tax=Pseudomonas emilianonis TaxID=2915812 RepID=A0ABT0ECC9_9PSED|nr:hypothetical protein [Pseudomonas emilianonis]MCK1783370.1 hypothetical protein [Pseudomonas emilianonis]
MSTIYEVTIDGGSVVEKVKGERIYVDNGFLIIEGGNGASVAIFAKFDSVTAKQAEQE